MNDYKKKISHLKNIDSKLADHILDEIIERYMIVYSNVCKCTCYGLNLLPGQFFSNQFIFLKLVYIF